MAVSKEPLTNRPLGDQHLVNVHQAKTHLSQLLQEVEQGQEVVIARSGVPIARLVAWQAPARSVTPPGAMRVFPASAHSFQQIGERHPKVAPAPASGCGNGQVPGLAGQRGRPPS
jgi:antitoxin (DNA-binding transcriptional repressor) of toxin-antitoxin stability system